jgi:BolA protein
MNRQEAIRSKLAETFRPMHLEVVDESHMHSVPAGAQSHFKVTLVSEAFIDQSLVQRHRAVNSLLADEFGRGLHALALHTMTPEEWFAKGGVSPDSPPCLGGSKADQEGH